MTTSPVYELLKSLAQTSTEEKFPAKAMLCCVLTGIDPERHLEMHKFGPNRNPILKPQYLHSAGSIYLILRNPILNPESSFADGIVRRKLISEAISVATDVLQTDSEMWAMIKEFEKSIQNYTIVDPSNGKMLASI